MAVLLFGAATRARTQNSLLVNFGTLSCAGSAEPAFSLISHPLTDTAAPLIACSLAAQVPDIYAVFIAYNPRENDLYLADIRSGVNTRIWKLNIGLPEMIACPALDSMPDYTYNYVSNNFEFDNNGNLWSFSNYVDTLGQCNIDNFDIASGTVLNTRIVQFPAGFFPTSISSGDLTILPNGRMFATLGSAPSKLYEIKNYSASTPATAVFLDSLPQSCYGIAYLNGLLELTGTDFFGNCYYYTYHIADGTLDSTKSFQAGQFPIDNTSITPSIGAAKQLVSTIKKDEHTADLTYEIYAENLGNVALNNVNISDNLGGVFGAGNVSQVQVAFTGDGNAAQLRLNPGYDGVNDTLLLLPGQSLPNAVGNSDNYFVRLRITLRVTGLEASALYNNSAIATASIGSIGTSSYTFVADSSNNGPASAVDPNNDGNATEPGENNPTPFNSGALPVKFTAIHASLISTGTAAVTWSVATPTIPTDTFEIEYSPESTHWITAGKRNIMDVNQSNYTFIQSGLPEGNLYYRIKETDLDENYVYSPVAVLKNTPDDRVRIDPNPADASIRITVPTGGSGTTMVSLFDATGRRLLTRAATGGLIELNTARFPGGIYIVKVTTDALTVARKIVIRH